MELYIEKLFSIILLATFLFQTAYGTSIEARWKFGRDPDIHLKSLTNCGKFDCGPSKESNGYF